MFLDRSGKQQPEHCRRHKCDQKVGREAARARIDEAGPAVPAGVTCPNDGVVVLRALGERVEPVMALLVQVRAAWRERAWGLADERPRVWRT